MATKQAKTNRERKPSPINGQVLPEGFEAHPERRHNGAWKKEDTLRYKWEQMLKLDDEELREVMNDPKASRVERITAEVLLDKDMKPTDKLASLEKLANQVYGFPKQVNENRNLEITPILPMKKDKK